MRVTIDKGIISFTEQVFKITTDKQFSIVFTYRYFGRHSGDTFSCAIDNGNKTVLAEDTGKYIEFLCDKSITFDKGSAVGLVNVEYIIYYDINLKFA